MFEVILSIIIFIALCAIGVILNRKTKIHSSLIWGIINLLTGIFELAFGGIPLNLLIGIIYGIHYWCYWVKH